MPIRINLLAEQQSAEEARRKDPLKRAFIIGGALVLLTMVWSLTSYMQLKAKRAEFANLEGDFKRVDDKAKGVRNFQAEAGDLERRITSLEKYSTNRVLWGSVLGALQQATMEQIRLKRVDGEQKYTTNAPLVFFTTNMNVPFNPPPAAWKFWAGPAQAVDVTAATAKTFGSFTNSAIFATNKLPYTVKASVSATNAIAHELVVKVDFTLPAVSTEETAVVISGGDYGNPPGGSIDEYARVLTGLPYFSQRLTTGVERAKFVERPPNSEPDKDLPNNPMHKRFVLRLRYEDRVLTNE